MKKKKILLMLMSIVLILLAVVIINFVPTLSLATSGMTKIEGEWVNVYYENEETAALDVFNLADSETARIAEFLGFQEKEPVNIYIYDHQQTMQQKKYGLLGPLLGLDWYIGDNLGTNVILTSPANPGNAHSYDSVKQAVVHEVVHAYVSVKNPKISLWLTEGLALYLSNGEPFFKEYLQTMEIPTFKETKTSNPITFSKANGYTYATTYIEFLVDTYGMDKVNRFIDHEDYSEIFKRTQKELYFDWLDYLNNYDQ